MSLGKPEKICPHDSAGIWRREAKRARNKKLRLSSKRDPENAPTKVGNYGWST